METQCKPHKNRKKTYSPAQRAALNTGLGMEKRIFWNVVKKTLIIWGKWNFTTTLTVRKKKMKMKKWAAIYQNWKFLQKARPWISWNLLEAIKANALQEKYQSLRLTGMKKNLLLLNDFTITDILLENYSIINFLYSLRGVHTSWPEIGVCFCHFNRRGRKVRFTFEGVSTNILLASKLLQNILVRIWRLFLVSLLILSNLFPRVRCNFLFAHSIPLYWGDKSFTHICERSVFADPSKKGFWIWSWLASGIGLIQGLYLLKKRARFLICYFLLSETFLIIFESSKNRVFLGIHDLVAQKLNLPLFCRFKVFDHILRFISDMSQDFFMVICLLGLFFLQFLFK